MPRRRLRPNLQTIKAPIEHLHGERERHEEEDADQKHGDSVNCDSMPESFELGTRHGGRLMRDGLLLPWL